MPNFRAVLQIHHSQISALEEVVGQWQNALQEPQSTTELCVALVGNWDKDWENLLPGVCVHRQVIPPEIDRYESILRPKTRWNPWGLKSGPNWQFFRLLEEIGQQHIEEWVLLLEPDTQPVATSLPSKLKAVVSLHSEAWVIGAVEPPEITERLEFRVRGHINGSALYRVGNRKFSEFAQSVWLPSLFALIDQSPEYPFDVVTAPGLWPSLPLRLQQAWEECAHRFVKVSQLLNTSSLSADQAEQWCQLGAFGQGPLAEYLSEALVLHAKVSPRIVAAIRKRKLLEH